MSRWKFARASAALWVAAWTGAAWAGATFQDVGTVLPTSWPISPYTGTLPVIDSGDNGAQGSPASVISNQGGPSGTDFTDNLVLAPADVAAETFTPAARFNLGAISFIFSGEPTSPVVEAGINFSLHLFQLQAVNGSSGGYVLKTADASGDLLGGGNGLAFTFGGSNEAVTEFDFNNIGTADQVPLLAGDTYGLEIWNTDPSDSFSISNTNAIQTYAGGQVYEGGDGSYADTQNPFSSVVRSQIIPGPSPANLMFAVYAAANGNWVSAGGGSWASGSNWSNGVIPRNPGDLANFAAGAVTASTVTLDGNWTVGQVVFNSTNSYTLAGGANTVGILVLNSGSTVAAMITNGGGSHAILAAIDLQSNLAATIANPGDALNLAGGISGSAFSLAASGSGTLVLSGVNTYGGGTSMNPGVAVIINAAGALPAGGSVVNNGLLSVEAGTSGAPVLAGKITGIGTLAVNGGGVLQLAVASGADTQAMISVSTGSTLDITNNKLVINYGIPANDPVTAIAAEIAAGRNGGAWNGAGIDSSAITSSKFAIGYADSDGGDSDPGLQPNQLIIKYTLAGDANLENSVGIADLLIVAQNFGRTGKDWAHGNFNYDPHGSVGIGDLLLVAQNFGKTSGVSESVATSPVISRLIGSTAAVPEPAEIGFALIAIGGLVRRRRYRYGFT